MPSLSIHSFSGFKTEIHATKYLSGINGLQTRIMKYIDWWVRNKKTPVPHQFLLKQLKSQKVLEETAKASIRVLLDKHYIRKSEQLSRETYYVQLRTIYISKDETVNIT